MALAPRPAPDAPEALLIERARRAGDPWSGHMAFPGGRVERADTSVRGAAEREPRGSRHRSRGAVALDDLEGRHSGKPVPLVAIFGLRLSPRSQPIAPSPEAEASMWTPVSALVDPAHHVDYAYPPAGGARYPGIVVGDPEKHVVGGYLPVPGDLLPGGGAPAAGSLAGAPLNARVRPVRAKRRSPDDRPLHRARAGARPRRAARAPRWPSSSDSEVSRPGPECSA